MCNVQALFTNGIIRMTEEEEIVEESLTLEFVLMSLILALLTYCFAMQG
jgi:hypothetical protein